MPAYPRLTHILLTALLVLIAAPITASEQTAPEESLHTDFALDRGNNFLGSPIQRGTMARREWSAAQPLAGLALPSAVLVAAGKTPGPTVCLTAAVHGDELNGVEIIRRIMYSLDAAEMNGTVIGVPIVNMHGFRRSSRYLPDRRDLNRYFPGNPNGSSASRIAHSFFNDVIRHCDWLIDIHTGSFHRTNLPQLRADLSSEAITTLSQHFGELVVLHSPGASGTLRRAAAAAGVPAVVIEAGEPLRLQPEAVAQGVRAIRVALQRLGILNGSVSSEAKQPVFYQSIWLRAEQSGVLISDVELGKTVRKGDVLGTVTDPITNQQTQITAPRRGRVLGMALNQMVMPGFAAFHLGVDESGSALASREVARRVADQALQPVREAIVEAAQEAAVAAVEQNEAPQAVSTAARVAAEEAISGAAAAAGDSIKRIAPEGAETAAEDDESHDSEAVESEPNDHPE